MAAKNRTAEILTVKTGKLKGQFRFKLIAINGKVIAQSYPETYIVKKSCVDTLHNNFPDFVIVDKTK